MINIRFSWIYSSWRYLLKYFWSVTSTICTRIVLVCTWLCRLADLFEKRVFLWLNDQYSVFLDLFVLKLSAQILLICYFCNLYSDSFGLHLTVDLLTSSKNAFSSDWMINIRFSWIYSSWRYLLKYFWSVTSTICTRIVLVCAWLCRLADLFENRVFLWLTDQ